MEDGRTAEDNAWPFGQLLAIVSLVNVVWEMTLAVTKWLVTRQLRTAERQQDEHSGSRQGALQADRSDAVPDGWPPEVKHPRAWSGVDFQHLSEFVAQLTADDIKEAEEALALFLYLSLLYRSN
ncbi:hypothetical protein B0I35DRAFT_482028 [Stachybotrys elegans]|uniref:Uncharacterized protein n=1 Tax=Stachybotrys elegans TaxID=80388 RepID=A0A8K0SPV7_9HYPO|nr:hypothetical protein B0I35DRAFT_482028 [Stachybotrys elegans]